MRPGLAGREDFENDQSFAGAAAVDDAVGAPGAGASCTGAAATGAETRTGRAGPAFAGAGRADVIHSGGACERMIVFKILAAR